MAVQEVAKEIAVFAQAQDNGRGEFYQKVVALGPGTVRIWQLGQKDMVGPESQPPPMLMNGLPPKGMPMRRSSRKSRNMSTATPSAP